MKREEDIDRIDARNRGFNVKAEQPYEETVLIYPCEWLRPLVVLNSRVPSVATQRMRSMLHLIRPSKETAILKRRRRSACNVMTCLNPVNVSGFDGMLLPLDPNSAFGIWHTRCIEPLHTRTRIQVLNIIV